MSVSSQLGRLALSVAAGQARARLAGRLLQSWPLALLRPPWELTRDVNSLDFSL